MSTVRTFLAWLLAVSLYQPLGLAQETENTVLLPSLAELAASADLVALVRVLDTDYEYTRDFPSGGRAFLEILIPYKLSRPLEDMLVVYEEGLHAGECYFDNPGVSEEGRRYLVFLKFSPDVADQYNGLPGGCKLEVLVTADNRYAVRYPPNGLSVRDDLAALAEALDYADRYAAFDYEELTPPERIALEQGGFLARNGDRWKYTHGIPLAVLRALMGPDGLTLDRSLRQPAPVDLQDTMR